MKKLSKVLFAAFCAASVGNAMAVDANCVRLSFQPVGVGDRGSEWYAVCGSKDETFAGITADGKAVDPEGDKIFGFLKSNNLGRITCTFNQDGMEHFFVYLLDTTDTEGEISATRPTVVNGVQEVLADVSLEGVAGLTVVDASGKPVEFTAAPSDFVEGQAASIVAIDTTTKADKVLITVENVHPALKYNVRSGEDVAGVKDAELGDSPRTSTTGTVTFEVDKNTEGGAQFFKLVRQPLK